MNVLKQIAYRQMNIARRVTQKKPACLTPLGSMTMDRDDIDLVRQMLANRSTWYESQPVEEYAQTFAAWNGSVYAFPFMSARVALSAILDALKLTPGDEVILPGYTCVVVPNAIRFAKLKPVFVDIELTTYGLDANQLQKHISPRTRVVLLHHLYGLVCRDYERILEIARTNNLFVIEDCAQATGARYKERHVGTRGDAAIYSSEKSKLFTTVEGGIAVTDDPQISEGIRTYMDRAPHPSAERIHDLLTEALFQYASYKSPGRWWRRDWAAVRLGEKRPPSTTHEEIEGRMPHHYGQKMPAALARLGLNQLKKLNRYNQRRREHADRWEQWCQHRGFQTPNILQKSEPVFLRYPFLANPEQKKEPQWLVQELHVQPGVWFTSHTHPAPSKISDCPNADTAVACCLNLPCLT